MRALHGRMTRRLTLLLNRTCRPSLLSKESWNQATRRSLHTRPLRLSEALVLLSSAGGNAHAAMEIGKAIRLMGFPTVILAEIRCASACALAWLGGQPRFMASTAKVGFHAVFTRQGERLKESAPGNALVGAYLNSLGLPTKAVFYITKTPPDSMA